MSALHTESCKQRKHKTGKGTIPMTISMQTLHDTIVAILATVGVAVAASIAFVAIGAYLQRGKAQARKLAHARTTAVPAQHPTQTDSARELVLR